MLATRKYVDKKINEAVEGVAMARAKEHQEISGVIQKTLKEADITKSVFGAIEFTQDVLDLVNKLCHECGFEASWEQPKLSGGGWRLKKTEKQAKEKSTKALTEAIWKRK